MVRQNIKKEIRSKGNKWRKRKREREKEKTDR